MRLLLTALAAAALAAALAAPLAAQTPADDAARQRQRVEAIFGVPQRADEARQAGVPDSTIRAIMKIFGKEQVTAEDVVVILSEERDAARAGGSKDNFGAFVQRQHAAGLRGRELSAAIHAEQVRRGMKRGGAQGMEHGDAMNKGKKPDEVMNKGKKPEEEKGKGKKPDDANRHSR